MSGGPRARKTSPSSSSPRDQTWEGGSDDAAAAAIACAEKSAVALAAPLLPRSEWWSLNDGHRHLTRAGFASEWMPRRVVIPSRRRYTRRSTRRRYTGRRFRGSRRVSKRVNRLKSSVSAKFIVSCPAFNALSRARVGFYDDSLKVPDTGQPSYLYNNRFTKGAVWNYHQMIIQPWNNLLEAYPGVLTRRALLTNRMWHRYTRTWGQYRITGVTVEFRPNLKRPSKPKQVDPIEMEVKIPVPSSYTEPVAPLPGPPPVPGIPGSITSTEQTGSIVATRNYAQVKTGADTLEPWGFNYKRDATERWNASEDRYHHKMFSTVWDGTRLLNYRGRLTLAARGYCIDGGWPAIHNARISKNLTGYTSDSQVPQVFNESDWRAQAQTRKHSPYVAWKRYVPISMPRMSIQDLMLENIGNGVIGSPGTQDVVPVGGGAPIGQTAAPSFSGFVNTPSLPAAGSKLSYTTRAPNDYMNLRQFRSVYVAALNVANPGQVVYEKDDRVRVDDLDAAAGTGGFNYVDQADGRPALPETAYRFGRYRVKFHVRFYGPRNPQMNQVRQKMYDNVGPTGTSNFMPGAAPFARPGHLVPDVVYPEVNGGFPRVWPGVGVDNGAFGGTYQAAGQEVLAVPSVQGSIVPRPLGTGLNPETASMQAIGQIPPVYP